jgi:serine/threonine protein kinase
MHRSFDNINTTAKPHRDLMVESPSDETEAMEIFSHDRDLASLAGKAAFYHSQTFDSQSNLLKYSPERTSRTCQVSWSDKQVGDLIGSGAFSHVREVKITGSCSCHSESRSSVCGSVRDKHYVVKLLKPSIKDSQDTFEAGAVDLVNESKLLTHLNHENIIRLHGTTQGCIFKAYFNPIGYFLVLECLDYTLEDLLKRLRIKDKQSSNRLTGRPRFSFRGGNAQKIQRTHRLQDIAVPVASALQHLHEKRVIYRDLKPANIGFDANGTPKLFDFGLAREIVDNDRQMTPCSGSLRYMSPENATSDNYGFPADVHSFGIVLWEILTLEKPFGGMVPKDFYEKVVKSGVRPKLDGRVGPKSLQSLIRQCWDPLPGTRPDFKKVTNKLQYNRKPASRFSHVMQSNY